MHWPVASVTSQAVEEARCRLETTAVIHCQPQRTSSNDSRVEGLVYGTDVGMSVEGASLRSVLKKPVKTVVELDECPRESVELPYEQ